MAQTNGLESATTSGENPTSTKQRPAGQQRTKRRKPDHLKERGRFRTLLLSNPNYFGNLPESPFEAELQIAGNTTYEEIGCVGFHPQFGRLEAVVYIKQPVGYGGNVCSAGTPEYVRFYLSFDGGATWEDQGVASFTAYDVPEGTEGDRRLEYAVAIEISPPRKFCTVPNVVQARAILSWNLEPPSDQPDFTPIWGDVHDTHLLVDPFKLKVPFDVFLQAAAVELKPEIADLVPLSGDVPLAQPKELALAELVDLYEGEDIEPHRFGLATVHKLIGEAGLAETLMAAQPGGIFADIAFDPSALIGPLAPTDGNTRYEELECVGLDPERDELVGVIRVKLPSGYSGGPCTAGSTEYVTFWADFDDNGTFETCLGTASVKVYDIADMPEEGLEYAVQLPVDLAAHRQPCDAGPRVVRIRAILSWQVAPPCANPDYVPVWGNREETLVHIRPGPRVEAGDFTPFLYSLCNRHVCTIDQTTGWATGDKPFGGALRIEGEIPAAMALSVADTLKYKVDVRPLSDLGAPIGPWQALVDSFAVQIHEGTGPTTAVSYPLTQHVDADGFYTYREYGAPPGPWRRVASPNRMLARWQTAGKTGLWEIRIEARDTVTNTTFMAGVTTCALDGSTRQSVKVRLDQSVPVATLAITGFSKNGGPVQPADHCDSFEKGVVIHGTYSATDADDHFRLLTLTLQPASAAGGASPDPSVRAYPTVPGSGESGSWTLETSDMDPCGYVVWLQVWDRTIRHCSAIGWGDEDFVGFCLVEPHK